MLNEDLQWAEAALSHRNRATQQGLLQVDDIDVEWGVIQLLDDAESSAKTTSDQLDRDVEEAFEQGAVGIRRFMTRAFIMVALEEARRIPGAPTITSSDRDLADELVKQGWFMNGVYFERITDAV
jgi:hypothetical protein